jgi:hypothetical protein
MQDRSSYTSPNQNKCLIKTGFKKLSDEMLLMGNDISKLSIFLAVLLMLFIMACLPGISMSADKASGKKEVKQQKNPYASAKIAIKIIPSVKKTFGYDIFVNGKPLIHQPNIPALPGNDGFTTRERARKVAEFVVRKIRKNEMPPTVRIEDLNNMGVLR